MKLLPARACHQLNPKSSQGKAFGGRLRNGASNLKSIAGKEFKAN